jgi:hypothetical protein
MTDRPAEKSAELQVTSGKVWRSPRREGIVVRLRSGNVARLKPIGLMELYKLGRIPNALMDIVVELITAKAVSPERAMQKVGESMSAIVELYDLICESAFVEPKVVKDPVNDDEISADDIPLEDKEDVLAFVNAPQAALQLFRQIQEEQLESVRDRENVRAETERSPEGGG